MMFNHDLLMNDLMVISKKDGTYSVVPRMWGGVTTPLELRTIADVVDKFNIPTLTELPPNQNP